MSEKETMDSDEENEPNTDANDLTEFETGIKTKKDIALTKLSIDKLYNTKGDESNKTSTNNIEAEIFRILSSNFGNDDNDIDDETDEVKGRTFRLEPQEKTMLGQTPVYFCRGIVTNTKDGFTDKKDQNSGEIWFVYWGTSLSDVTIYSFIRSGWSGAWHLLTRFRDYLFPKDFARVFLDPTQITNIETKNLIGVNASSQKMTYSKVNIFKPYHVTKEYGMVKNFTTYVEEKHSELKSMLNIETIGEKAAVTMQTGQIKLPLTVTHNIFKVEEHIPLLFLIHKELDKSKGECRDDFRWQFLDYMEFIMDRVQKKTLDKALRKEMLDYYNKNIEEPSCFDLEATLWYHHQDTFYNCSSVKLLYKGNVIPWNYNTTERKGLSIETKDVFVALKTNSIDIEEEQDWKNVSLQFWDEKNVKELLEHMIPAHILSTTAETKRKASYFKQGKCWYSVTQNWYFDTTVRFVNAVKECFYEKNEYLDFDDGEPEILPWNLPSKRVTKFTIKDLYTFCVIPNQNPCNDPDAKTLKQLRDILITETSLYTTTGENNLLDQYNDKKHLTGRLLLNKSLIIKSYLDKDDDIKKHGLKADNCTTEEKTLQEKLKAKRRICKPTDDPDYTAIETPHLTKDIWGKLSVEFPQICPLRLCQFLRMNCILAEEGDYNELYHLSNCICRKSQWSYVVGDRIFGSCNYHIELFDVMAINKDRTKAFLLHVKNGIDANASRNVCSQVKVSIEYLWNSVMAHSSDSMMERFYNASTKSDESIHKQLTYCEMKDLFQTKENFLETVISEKLKYYVCLVPCLSVTRKLKDLTDCNLDFKFNSDSFLPPQVIDTLKKLQIINAVSGRIMPKFFSYTSEEQFFNEMKDTKLFDTQKKIKETYKYIRDKLSGGTNTSLLSHQTSFIAKTSYVDLYNEHQRFKLVHGKTPIQLRIIQIDRLEDSKVDNDVNDENDTNISPKRPRSTSSSLTRKKQKTTDGKA